MFHLKATYVKLVFFILIIFARRNQSATNKPEHSKKNSLPLLFDQYLRDISLKSKILPYNSLLKLRDELNRKHQQLNSQIIASHSVDISTTNKNEITRKAKSKKKNKKIKIKNKFNIQSSK